MTPFTQKCGGSPEMCIDNVYLLCRGEIRQHKQRNEELALQLSNLKLAKEEVGTCHRFSPSTHCLLHPTVGTAAW